MPGKVNGRIARDRARAIRQVGTELAARFRASQFGCVRSALTIDGGRIAVTDNYLKVSIAPGVPDNQRVRVRIRSGEPLTGDVVDG
jgi:tRNA A37 methylthiotransferase MiaB